MVLLNDAKSAANTVKSVEKSAKSCPPKPAALPKTPKVPAASYTACLDKPNSLAAILEKSETPWAPSPKMVSIFDTDSAKSLAF